MWEAITELFTSGDFWSIVIKVLVTAILTAAVGLLGTLIGKIIAKNKHSKIYKYADTVVKAAEIKFPNEGKKMGPEKMQYVMDQLAIKFPKIKDNRFLYNIAEAAVYQLNEDKRKEAAIEEFKEKYGEDPLCVKNEKSEENITQEKVELTKSEVITDKTSNSPKKKNKLSSF